MFILAVLSNELGGRAQHRVESFARLQGRHGVRV